MLQNFTFVLFMSQRNPPSGVWQRYKQLNSLCDSHLNVSDEGHSDSFFKLVQRRVEVQDFHDLQETAG